MQKKSIIATVLGLIVSGVAFFSPNTSVEVQQWLGLLTFTATFVLTTFFPSGVWNGDGFKAGFYVTVVGGFLLQFLTMVDFLNIPPAYINWAVLAITYIVQEFGRTYNKTAA